MEKSIRLIGAFAKPLIAILFCSNMFLIISIIMIAATQANSDSSGNDVTGFDIALSGGYPEQVESYRDIVIRLCDEYNTAPDKLDLPAYVNAMLALIQIESGGVGSDPMQASECGYNTKYPRVPNGIQDAEYSLACGIQYARDAFILFGVQGPEDFDRIAAAVQGYNFGITGWYKWISEKGGKYTVELAQQYSNECMPEGAKGTPTHAQKFLTAYQGALTKAPGSAELDNIIYYKQWDERWASYPYGNGTIQSSGCGITCMAMIVATFIDNTITPPVMADLSMKNGGYVSGQGSAMPVVVSAAAKEYKLQYKSISFDEIEKYLGNGAFVIWGCHTGYFSSSAAGHVMIIRGMQDGKILLADPNREENNTKAFEPSFIQQEAKGYYIAVWK